MGFNETTVQTPAQEELEGRLLRIVDGNVEAVLQNFTDVEPLLEPAGLEHVVPFWRTYGAVSLTVYNRLGTGSFRRPDDVAKTLPIFFNQARKPLLAYALGQPQYMSPEWFRSIYDPKVRAAAPGLQFLMHMNSHINNDLARALDLSGVAREYKPDYSKVVGSILEEVALQHAPEYIPLESAAMRSRALKVALGYIAVARELAWRDGFILQTNHHNARRHALHVRRIEQNALLQGRAMLYTGSFALRAANRGNSYILRKNA